MQSWPYLVGSDSTNHVIWIECIIVHSLVTRRWEATSRAAAILVSHDHNSNSEIDTQPQWCFWKTSKWHDSWRVRTELPKSSFNECSWELSESRLPVRLVDVCGCRLLIYWFIRSSKTSKISDYCYQFNDTNACCHCHLLHVGMLN